VEDSPRWMKHVERALDGLSFVCMLVASIALVVLIVTFGWLVFGRYVLNSTPTWVEQLALLLICYITYLGAAVGIHDNTHLGVTLFRDMLPAKLSTLLKVVIDVVLAVFGLFMMKASFDLVLFGWSTMLPMLGVPEGVRSMSAALCGGLVFIFAGTRVVFRIACLMHGKTYVERGLI